MRAIPALLVTLLVLVLVGWVYWPGQLGPALLDDRSSVLVIGDLKQNPELAWDYVTGDGSGPLGRPVSMASFVLEKMFLEGGPAASKRVNILLHLVNGALVIWLFWLLFRHIAVPGYRWLALALGAAWLLSPLYVSTVLYIVQRMAMLSSTFMLLACISFIYWRSRLSRGEFSLALLGLVVVNFCLAMLAKENAIVLIPTLLLLEALWFGFRDESGRIIRWLQLLTLGSIAVGGLALVVVLVVDYEGLAAAFGFRYFTLDERLLTQARIVWDYVGQLYAPDVSAMGLYHDDVVVSKSLREPVSTLYAVLAWLFVVLLLAVLMLRQWGRRLALGITWFLVGHSVESTVLPLELYFEHRNYFPGVGLFLLPGVVFALVVKQWPQTSKPLLVYLACFVIWLASLAGSQVQIWSNQSLLILNHLNAHPNSFRANADMAVQMANIGEFAAARKYSDRAFAVSTGEREGDRDIRELALSCIANRAVAPEQIDTLGLVNPARPFGSVTTLLTLVRLLQDDACPDFDRLRFANRMVTIFLAEDRVATASANIYNALAVLENALQRWELADAYIGLYLQQSPENPAGLLMKLHFASALGKVEEVATVIAQLQKMDSQGELTVGQRQTLSLYLEH
jgi:protein O-mannosyl-transferase